MTGNLSTAKGWRNSLEHRNLVRALEGTVSGASSSIHFASLTPTEGLVLLRPLEEEAYLKASVPFLLRMHSCNEEGCPRCTDQHRLLTEYGLDDSGKLNSLDVIRFFRHHYFDLDQRLPDGVEALSIPLLVNDLNAYVAGGDIPSGVVHRRQGEDYLWCPVGEIKPENCIYLFTKEAQRHWLWIFRRETQQHWEVAVIRASWAYIMGLPAPLCMGDFLRTVLYGDIFAE